MQVLTCAFLLYNTYPWDHFHLEGVILKSVDMETMVRGAYQTV